MVSARVLVLAGEASGEMHAAALVKGVLQRNPAVEFLGVGGQEMEAAGVNLFASCSDISVVGGVEGIESLPAVLGVYRRVKRMLTQGEVDLFLPVDYPGMNLKLSCHAKKSGVPVCYYISPQVWAWRKGRVKTISRCVDRMLVILPFEEELYRGAGVDARYVGHPILSRVRPEVEREGFREKMGIPNDSPLFTLMPGSRPKEVHYNLPVMLKAASILNERLGNAVFALALAPTLRFGDLGSCLSAPGLPEVQVVRDDAYSLLNASDAAILASGTATLEAALLGVPMVVVYRVHPSTYQVGKRLVKVQWLSLVNNVLQAPEVPELLQDAATPQAVAEEVLKVMGEKRAAVQRAGKLREMLSPPGDLPSAAELVLELLEKGRC